MSTPILEVKGINKSFTGHRVLHNIDLKIYPGEVICLAGENGCGKSTLIKIVSGVYQPDSGSVYFNGVHFPKLNPVISIQQGVQVIYQDSVSYTHLTLPTNMTV